VGPATPGITTVAVTLSELRIEVDAKSASAGEVTFEAENAGTIPYEPVVVRSDEEPGVLPVVDGKVDESRVDVIGEIEEFPAGETASETFNLTAANYVLICNLPAHYEQGMYLGFTVP
jgi:uncharacterized cupredoxin-like copper-binding protein